MGKSCSNASVCIQRFARVGFMFQCLCLLVVCVCVIAFVCVSCLPVCVCHRIGQHDPKNDTIIVFVCPWFDVVISRWYYVPRTRVNRRICLFALVVCSRCLLFQPTCLVIGLFVHPFGSIKLFHVDVGFLGRAVPTTAHIVHIGVVDRNPLFQPTYMFVVLAVNRFGFLTARRNSVHCFALLLLLLLLGRAAICLCPR